MKRIKVDSSMVSEIGYDAKTQEMEAVFHSGAIWRYSGVTKDVYEELIASDSIGGYMRDFIIDMYPDYRVRREDLFACLKYAAESVANEQLFPVDA